MPSKSIYIPANSNILFFFGWAVYNIFLIHSSVDGQLVPHITAVVNKFTVNTGVCGSFQISVFVLFSKCILRSGISVSYFYFLRNSVLFSQFHTSRWVSCTYMHIYSFYIFSIQVVMEYWVEFPVLHSRFLFYLSKFIFPPFFHW